MNQNQLTFSSQNLVVDYISLKFQNLQSQQTEITNYLCNLGFNVYQESGRFKDPKKQELLTSPKNSFQVIIVLDNSYWPGSLVQFSGLNAFDLYRLIQDERFNWKMFDTAILNRFDIY